MICEFCGCEKSNCPERYVCAEELRSIEDSFFCQHRIVVSPLMARVRIAFKNLWEQIGKASFKFVCWIGRHTP